MKNRIATCIILLCLFAGFNLKAQSGTWVSLTSGTTSNLIGVSAVSDDTVYVCGYNGTVLKTTDGGATWAPMVTGTAQALYSIYFTDADHGIAVGDTIVTRTTDGGLTWTPIILPTPSYRCVYFYDDSLGFIEGGASGLSGEMYRTTDGGASWTQSVIASSVPLYDVKFTSALVGYTSNYNGNIFKTTDGGISWLMLTSGTTAPLVGIDFINPNNGIIVGGFTPAIMKTTNAGSTWTSIPVANNDRIGSIKFYTSTSGFITGGNVANNTGVILSTVDGGNTWSVLVPGTPRLCKLDFASPNTGYIAGLDGTILKYVNNVGINENGNTITINPSPNPASGVTTIDLSNYKEHCTFQLCDLTGKIIRKTENIVSGKFLLEQKDLSGGMYLFTILSDGKIAGAGKIIFE